MLTLRLSLVLGQFFIVHAFMIAPVSKSTITFCCFVFAIILLDSLGIPPKGPTFHSLRDCFRDAMSEADLSQEVSAFFGGWKLPGVMNEVYGSSKLRRSYKSQIDKISYSDVDQMIVSQAC